MEIKNKSAHLIFSLFKNIYSFYTQFLAHAVVVGEHVLVSGKVEFVVVLGEFSVRDGLILVDDASDLHDSSCSHAFWISLELYYLDV